MPSLRVSMRKGCEERREEHEVARSSTLQSLSLSLALPFLDVPFFNYRTRALRAALQLPLVECAAGRLNRARGRRRYADHFTPRLIEAGHKC